MIDLAGLVTKGLFFHGEHERRISLGKILDKFNPGLIVTNMGSDSARNIAGYTEVFSAYPQRKLLMRDDLKKVFDRRDPNQVSPPGHPIMLLPESVRSRGREPRGFVALETKTALTDGGTIETGRNGPPWEGAETAAFLIDFDELTFKFAASHPTYTRAELLIDGVPLFHAGGNGTNKLRPISWPLYPWRGKTATLRFSDIGPQQSWLQASELQSIQYARSTALDRHLASSEGNQTKLLSETFLLPESSPLLGPLGNDEVAVESSPFLINAPTLTFIAVNRSPDSAILLTVAGRRVRRYSATGAQTLVPKTWIVDDLLGKVAKLQLRPFRQDPEGGIGILGPKLVSRESDSKDP